MFCFRSEWIEAIPALGKSKVKSPSVCCMHFKPSDYGKNKKYLKPDAVPSKHLDLNNDEDLEDLGKLCKKQNKTKKLNLDPLLDSIPNKSSCSRNDCADIYMKAKILQTENQTFRNQIRFLEKRLKRLEDKSCSITKKECIKRVLTDCSMLGPTQIKCLANNTTKGRNWSDAEKTKGLILKNMCNHKCYNYVRKNLVPLPCIW